MIAAMTLFNAFSSDSYSISFARHLLDFFAPAYFLASAADSVRNCARYLLARLPYSSPALLTNGPIVLQLFVHQLQVLSESRTLRQQSQLCQKICRLLKKSSRWRAKLIEYESEEKALNKVIAAIIYQGSSGEPLEYALLAAKKMSLAKKTAIISKFSSLRNNRRQRPSRAFEMTEYTFDMVNNFGMFRDMHRHRALTLSRQLLTTDHGFSIPKELRHKIPVYRMHEKYTRCL